MNSYREATKTASARIGRAAHSGSRSALAGGVSLCAIALGLGATSAPGAVLAQTTGKPASTTIAEVIVTAERRAENIQQVPLSVAAINGDTLVKLNAQDFFDYATTVPNLAFGSGAGSGGNGTGFGVTSSRAISIRGVFGNNTTSYYINDTPVPMSLDPRVVDVAQIEILRGPQGTLFGASAMGGTVRVTTREPVTGAFTGYVDAQGYDMEHGGAGYSVNGTVNFPVGRDVAVRVSAFDAYQPGYFTYKWGPAYYPGWPGISYPAGATSGVRDHIGALPEYGASVTLKWTPQAIPGLTVEPMAMFQNSSTNGFPLADYSTSNLVQLRPLDIPEITSDRWQLESLTLRYHTNFGEFISSSSYFQRRAWDSEDGTEWAATVGVPSLTGKVLPVWTNALSPSLLAPEIYTQEVRFQSTFDLPIQLIAGVFYQYQRRIYYQLEYSPGANALTGGALGTDLMFTETAPNIDKQIAGFADLTWQVTKHIQVAAGLREASLTHSFVYTANGWANGGFSTSSGSHSELDPAPRFTAKYAFDDQNMIYASAAKGFRIGGVNAAFPFCGTGQTPFTSDSLWNYEVGAKDTWADGKVESRVSLYHIDWSNIQQQVVLPCTFSIVENAGGAKSDGAEVEIDLRPIPQLTVGLGAGYEDARITQAVAGGAFYVGQPISGVPTWTTSATFDYTQPEPWGAAFLRGQVSYVGKSYSFNISSRLRKSYANIDLNAGVDIDRYEVSLFVKNLGDVHANLGDEEPEVGELPGRPKWVISTPREVGVDLKVRFGG